jgi:hypothetical protein
MARLIEIFRFVGLINILGPGHNIQLRFNNKALDNSFHSILLLPDRDHVPDVELYGHLLPLSIL